MKKRYVISGARNTLKTTKLIIISAVTNTPILVRNGVQKKIIAQIAEYRGFRIPEPLTVSDIVNKRGTRDIEKGVLVDEAISMLENILGVKINGITMSMED